MEAKTAEKLKLGAKALVTPLITAFSAATGVAAGAVGTVVAPIGAIGSFGASAVSVIQGKFQQATDFAVLGGLCTAFSAASYGLAAYMGFGYFPAETFFLSNMAVGAAIGTAAGLGYCGYKMHEQWKKIKNMDTKSADAPAESVNTEHEDHAQWTGEPQGEPIADVKKENLIPTDDPNIAIKESASEDVKTADVVVLREKFNCHSCGSTTTPIRQANAFGGFDTSCSSCGADAGGTSVLQSVELRAA